MTTTTKLVHISHEHPLILIDDFDAGSIAAPLVCGLCVIPIIGVCHAYTCSQCSFFLHKRCAESPKQINHPMHPKHQLFLSTNYNHLVHPDISNTFLLPRTYICCAGCTREITLNMWIYSCKFCHFGMKIPYLKSPIPSYQFALCMRCAVIDPVLGHEGHQQHPLTLLRRRAFFWCNACGTEAWDISSYTCLTCHYWIHSFCAASPHTIKLRVHEDDTLQLIYSIPERYRRFTRHCPICRLGVSTENWAYFCENSGYFVHITCATALLSSGQNVIKTEDGDGQTYPDLMQFPLASADALMANLIAESQSQSGKPADHNTLKEEGENETHEAVIHHWSHKEHPLILLEELKNADNSDDEESNSNNHIDEMLICDGCTEPISTISYKHYYGCIGCNFFIHTSCASHLPLQSAPGKCVFDPQHTLKLQNSYNGHDITFCTSCATLTNGFMYECIEFLPRTQIDLSCCLAPRRIKHEYHKHPLVHRPSTPNNCNACLSETNGFEYGCETCSNIQMHPHCALSFPKLISHRWDSHSISLTYPPIYYKGLRYCELCELEVNQEAWLYRCRECDQCFHPLCIRQPHKVKLGKTIVPSSRNPHSHTLTLRMVDKSWYADRVHKYWACSVKREGVIHASGEREFYFECAGCDYQACLVCTRLHALSRSPLWLG